MRKPCRKIIYIANAKLPTHKAHGYQIVKTCEQLVAAGVALELWVPQRREVKGLLPLGFYQLKQSFPVLKFPTLDMSRRGGLFNLLSHAVQLWSFYTAVYLRACFHSRQVTVYSRDLMSLFLSLLGYSVVYECHRIPQRSRWLFFRMCRMAAQVVTVTESMKKEFVKERWPEEAVLVAQDAVDLTVFGGPEDKRFARAKLSLNPQAQIILYTGALTTMGMSKGVDDILQALTLLPQVTFIAVGGTKDDISTYTQRARQAGVDQRVQFKSKVDQPTLSSYQKAADVLLMPFPFNQHYAYYMSPLKMFEYMASKRPILTTDLPAVREVLNERNALFVPSGDPTALARGVQELLNSQDLARELAARARQDARNYTWEKRIDKILNFICA